MLSSHNIVATLVEDVLRKSTKKNLLIMKNVSSSSFSRLMGREFNKLRLTECFDLKLKHMINILFVNCEADKTNDFRAVVNNSSKLKRSFIVIFKFFVENKFYLTRTSPE